MPLIPFPPTSSAYQQYLQDSLLLVLPFKKQYFVKQIKNAWVLSVQTPYSGAVGRQSPLWPTLLFI